MAVKNILLGVTKVIIGLFLALVVLSLAGAATARYFITRLSELPERPLFDNDAPAQPESDTPAEAPAAAPPAEPAAAPPAEPAASSAPGLYEVVVVYPQGLLVRTGPSFDDETINGVAYDEQITVLEEKDLWYRIRMADGTEGWVKGKGNTKKVDG